MHISTCLNCGNQIKAGPYCEQCGQRNVHARLDWTDLVSDIKSQILEWNLPWLLTIKEMLLRPAGACRDYVDGKRVRYVNPLKYLLYIASIVLLLLQVLPASFDPLEWSSPLPTGPAPSTAPNTFGAFFADNPLVLLILMSPIVALFFRVLYARTRFNKTEIVCFILFIIGNSILLLAVTNIFLQLLAILFLNIDSGSFAYLDFMTAKLALITLLIFAYIVNAASQYFSERWYISAFKTLLIVISYGVLFLFAYFATVISLSNPVAAPRTASLFSSARDSGQDWFDSEVFLRANLDENRGLIFGRLMDPMLGSREESLLSYGNFLLEAGRNKDGIYYLLLADEIPPAERQHSDGLRTLLALAYMSAGSYEFADTQFAAGSGVRLQRLAFEAALAAGDLRRVTTLAAQTEELRELNIRMAALWTMNDLATALEELQRMAIDTTTAGRQKQLAAQWAAVLGNPGLAWYLLHDNGDKHAIWLPHFSEVRKLPAFKQFVIDEGLADYWRSTGKWADQCRPVGADDFQCF